MRLLTGLTADLAHAMPLAGAATDFGSGRAGPAGHLAGQKNFSRARGGPTSTLSVTRHTLGT